MTEAAVKLVKGLQADHTPATYAGKNTSGLKVFGKNVLIAVDECAAATAGGIMVTDEYIERMTAGATTGCIFAIAAEGFRHFDDGTPWVGDKPQVGDRVCFEKYAGQLQVGVDKQTYRIMDYRCVAAAVDEEYVQSIGVDYVPVAKAD